MVNVTDPDMLYGMKAISAALKMPIRRAWHLRYRNALPVFQLYPGSRILCARRTALAAHLAERGASADQERAAS